MALQEPLLTNDHDIMSPPPAKVTSSIRWPTEEASRAKLYVPRHWPGGKRDDAMCILKYDAEQHLFKIVRVAENEEVVLDVMDPRDVIGANLEIKLFAGTTGGDADRFRNTVEEQTQREDTNEQLTSSMDASCDIFKPLGEDLEKIFTTTSNSNDAADAIPYDTQATAFLNIFSYPRKDPKNESWLSWCGLSGTSKNSSIALRDDVATPTLPPNPNKPSGDGHRYPHHRRLEVVPSQDFADIRTLAQAVRTVASSVADQDSATTTTRSDTPATSTTTTSNPTVGRKFLVLVNPKAGTNTATKVYENIVQPMLEQACIDHDMYKTESTRDAEDYMKNKENLSEYDAYICMGGDGVLHETIQGIKAREDAEEVRKKLTLGVVGCGTGNGLAKSILHASEENYSQLESMFVICKGKTTPMDLSTYYVGDKSYASFLTFTWAMIADVDLESEYIRCLGSSRFDIWAVWRTLKLRKYRAKLSYLPPNADSKTKGIGSLPALSEPVPSDWASVEDDFVMLWASQVTHASVGTYHCPPSQMQDGVFHILVIRGPVSRFKILGLLLGLEHGTHVDSSIAEFIECVAYRLEPITEGSFNDLDGEEIESGPIQAKVEPAALRVFCAPVAPP